MMYCPISSSGAEQWLQRHPEADSSWPSWPETAYLLLLDVVSRAHTADRMYFFIGLRKSTPPRNRELGIVLSNSKQ